MTYTYAIFEIMKHIGIDDPSFDFLSSLLNFSLYAELTEKQKRQADKFIRHYKFLFEKELENGVD